MKAIDLDWNAIARFSKSEWPSGALEQMDARVILALSVMRDSLPNDHAIKPSPIIGAHVRQHGTSRHSTQGGTRLSDATDFYIPGGWKQALAAWQEAQRVEDIGGIGIYLNRWLGSPDAITPMMHIDTRPNRLLWVCHDGIGGEEYVYLHSNPRRFFTLLAEVGWHD